MGLITLLIGPYFVDWTSYRSTFETYASRVIQADVTINGDIDMRLLPEPRFELGDVVVGDSEMPFMSVERFDILVALAPLLSGRVEVLEMHLARPDVSVTLDDTGQFLLPLAPDTQDDDLPDMNEVIFADVEITDGRFTFNHLASDGSFSVSNLNLDFTAPALIGPYRLEGSGLMGGAPLDILVASGAWQDNDTLRLTSRLAPAIEGTVFSTDGTITLEPETRAASYQGIFKLSPKEKTADESADVSQASHGLEASLGASLEGDGGESPFALFDGITAEGQFLLDASRLLIERAEVGIGQTDDALAVEVIGGVELGSQPSFQALVSSKQLDANRLLGRSSAEPMAVSEAIQGLLGRATTLPATGLPGTIAVDVPGVVIGGGIVRGLRFDAITNGQLNGWRIETVEADLPGDTTLSAVGQIDSSADQISFDGRVRLASDRPNALLSWWRPDLANSVNPLPPFEMSGALVLGPSEMTLTNGQFVSADQQLAGSVFWLDEGTGGKPGLYAEIDGDYLDLDLVKAAVGAGLDLMLPQPNAEPTPQPNREADNTATGLLSTLPNLDLRIGLGSLNYAGGLANDINVVLALVNDKLSVQSFDIGDLAGVAVQASGVVEDITGAASGTLQTTIKAARVEPFADLLKRQFPDLLLNEWLLRSAESFDDVSLSASIRAAAEDDATRAELVFEGEVGGSELFGSLGFRGQLADWASGQVGATLFARNQDDFRLVRQLGMEPDLGPSLAAGYAPPALQPGQVEIRVSGLFAEDLSLELSSSLLGADLTYDGVVSGVGNAAPDFLSNLLGTGELRLQSDDTNRLWTALGEVPVNRGSPLPLDVTSETTLTADAIIFERIAGQIADADLTASLGLQFGSGERLLQGEIQTSDLTLPGLLGLSLPSASPIVASQSASSTSSESASDPANPQISSLYSSTLFAEPALSDLGLSLKVSANRVHVTDEHSASEATFDLRYSDGELYVTDFTAAFADGQLSADLSAKQVNGVAEIGIQAALADIDTRTLLWPDDVPAPISGRASLTLDADSLGRSPAALMSSWSGSGTISLSGAALYAVNPQAFDVVVQSVDAETVAIEEDAVRRLADAALRGGALQIAHADAAFTINGGKVRVSNVGLGNQDEILANGSLDLGSLDVEANWTLTGAATGDTDLRPQAIMSFSGPLASPQRRLDVGPLLAFLTLRSIEKQVDTIEDLEAERARDTERLRQLQDEAERRRIEEERKAAAERAEAARREQARQEARQDSSSAQSPSGAASSRSSNGATGNGPLVLVPDRSNTSQPLNLLDQ